MAQRRGRTPEQWEELGREAILDLLSERYYAPWGEVEARLAYQPWKHFPAIQPLQLEGARRSLVEQGAILPDTTEHHPPVAAVRFPFPEGRKRELTRLRGQPRKAYRRYMDWAGNQTWCGKHAERVVLDSAKAAATPGGLYVPPQAVGRIGEVAGVRLSAPLDCLAHILELPDLTWSLPLVVEVKNVSAWLYPWAREVWELLVKAAEVAEHSPVMPVLACVKSAWPTAQMAQDVGFLTCQFGKQLFSPDVPEVDFEAVREEFDLQISRHEGPLDTVTGFFSKVIRRSPPPSPPLEEIPFYKRQAERFQVLAPIVLRFKGLAEALSGSDRRRVYDAFRAAVADTVTWPRVKGW